MKKSEQTWKGIKKTISTLQTAKPGTKTLGERYRRDISTGYVDFKNILSPYWAFRMKSS